MRNQASVTIDRSAEEVFDFVTDPENGAYWQGKVRRVETLVTRTGGIGTQHRWLFDAGGQDLEVIETVVEQARPKLFAAQFTLKGLLNPPPQSLKGASATREELERQFAFFFGKGPRGGMIVVTIEAEAPGTVRLSYTIESDIGGYARLTARIGRFFGRRPLQDSLNALKAQIEAEI